jgi:hypothetical protein
MRKSGQVILALIALILGFILCIVTHKPPGITEIWPHQITQIGWHPASTPILLYNNSDKGYWAIVNDNGSTIQIAPKQCFCMFEAYSFAAIPNGANGPLSIRCRIDEKKIPELIKKIDREVMESIFRRAKERSK